VVCRHSGDVVMITPDKVDYMTCREAAGFVAAALIRS